MPRTPFLNEGLRRSTKASWASLDFVSSMYDNWEFFSDLINR